MLEWMKLRCPKYELQAWLRVQGPRGWKVQAGMKQQVVGAVEVDVVAAIAVVDCMSLKEIRWGAQGELTTWY